MKRTYCGAMVVPQQHAADAGIPKLHLLGEGLEELGRGEEAGDLAVLEDDGGLVEAACAMSPLGLVVLLRRAPSSPAGSRGR